MRITAPFTIQLCTIEWEKGADSGLTIKEKRKNKNKNEERKP